MYWQYVARSASDSRRFAVGDIHGCAQTLEALVMDKLRLRPKDQLFLLGDYINRGPDSAGVIDFILSLRHSGYTVYALRGNHEEMLMDSHLQSTARDASVIVPQLQKRKSITNTNGHIAERYQDFFFSTLYYIETEIHLLVHGGFNTENNKPFENYKTMPWQRHTSHNISNFTQKKIIHGHTVMMLSDIKKSIDTQCQVIGIDNGCYYGATRKAYLYENIYANLCALDLDTFELHVQAFVG